MKHDVRLISGGVVKPEEITTGVLQIETMGSGAKEPVVTGGGIIKNDTSSGGDVVTGWKQTGDLEKDGVTVVFDEKIREVRNGIASVWKNGADGIDSDGSNSVYSQNAYSKNYVNFKFSQPMIFKKVRAFCRCTTTVSNYSGVKIQIKNNDTLVGVSTEVNGGSGFEVVWEGQKEGNEISIKLRSAWSNTDTGDNFVTYLYSLQVEADYV